MSILSCLDGLSSLKSLSLADLTFDSTSLYTFQIVLETISSKLLHLEVLDLSGNNLTNEILPSLRGFKSLKELYLDGIRLDSDLHIQELCATILKNLEILDISNNNFNNTDIGSALSGLSSLKNLNLAWNEITPKSIHNISKLRSLEILDLGENNLKLWPAENHRFAWPSGLQVLVLNNNDFSNDIISSISGLSHLKSLDASSNNLKGSLDITENHGFAWPSSLQVISLSSNNFSNDIISFISDLSRLKSLDLRSNNLKGSLDITDSYNLDLAISIIVSPSKSP
ncbi:probable inactive leucine-rich repeat receptor kinase XIAO [Vicia villosa]|uniref:probable inactive leucine-rich repeat receptor kinase XIAO n=1 Tax=Vicia villosa TaxID=3911 RepID=UPI00273C7F7C|nr:probable inactive leucine-rich repeat receptor kinase XIAO [Vicia villosa]XP_058768901.1 probable inactive leucine-rich repeat receptor kinase XIAO [Vicia villosa]